MKQPQQQKPARLIVGVPLNTETVEEIDAHAMAQQRPRAQFVRVLILDALARLRNQPVSVPTAATPSAE